MSSVRRLSEDLIEEVVRLADIESYKARMEGHVKALQNQQSPLPVVEYINSSGCVNVSIAHICKAISCCFGVKCCGRETTTNYYVTQASPTAVILKTRVSSVSTTIEENQQTNNSFFLDLYTQHGEYLPYLMDVVTQYLPSDLKRYWKEWDPKSTEQLDSGKALVFRNLLTQAHQVMDDVRIEMMKKQMQETLADSAKIVVDRLAVETPSKKHIQVGESLMEFDRNKIIQDLLDISVCTKKQAEEISIQIEHDMPNLCTREQIWIAMKENVEKSKILIKPYGKSKFCTEILAVVDESHPSKVSDISPDRFVSIMKAKNIKPGAGRATFKQVSKLALKVINTPRGVTPRVWEDVV